MQKINYQKVTEKIIEEASQKGTKPKLLLQSCCGPCSSYVLNYLSPYLEIFLYYFNPNIYPYEEYVKRLDTQKQLLESASFAKSAKLVPSEYGHDAFLDAVKGMESLPEGGERCMACFTMRLEATAKKAAEIGADMFGTTLTVSPHKNAAVINEIGETLAKKYGVEFLFSDFKKKGGYKKSIELSAEFNLYRQRYCGCEFSLRDNT